MTAREMMFGTREEFEYFQCAACGTLQICEGPDLAPYYPKDYLAFDSEIDIAATRLRRTFAKPAGRYLLGGGDLIGRLVVSRKPWIKEHFPESMRAYPMGIDFDSRILDFGCGTGKLLQSLHYFGFTDLTGADAFIEKDITYPNGVTVYKRGLDELEPAFDLVMLHHSFEHLPDPVASLLHIRRLMQENSYCLIRIPVVNYAWEKYGVDWVQMDPPRHLFLYTENGFRRLAENAGLNVEHIYYDSGPFQFWGSEQYLRDIPLLDDRSLWVDPTSTIFSKKEIAAWSAEAEELNRSGRGDMACFYLRIKNEAGG